jgi:toluene monooxygenase system ferredoxin subunit
MYRRACPATELWIGEMRALELDGRPVVLINQDGAISAFYDRCPHQGFPVSRGRLQGTVLTCAAHEWQYDARTGCGLNPRSAALTRLAVEIRGGDIWIDVDGRQRNRS